MKPCRIYFWIPLYSEIKLNQQSKVEGEVEGNQDKARM